MACLTWFGCATEAVTRAEHTEVLASLKALRAENARLEQRLERLEQEGKLMPSAGFRPSTPRPAVSSQDAMPPLTVVKLKPKKDKAPMVSTAVEIQEPSKGELQALVEAVPEAADPTSAEADFEAGLAMMKVGNSEGGVAQMQRFVADWPRHPKADNALFLIGMAYWSQRDFERALEPFERVLKFYPAGDVVLDSMLKLAECRFKLSRLADARATWEQIVTTFPGTPAASAARDRLLSLSSVDGR